ILKQKRACFICFALNHNCRGCSAKVVCNLCKRRHHSILHNDDLQQKPSTSRNVTIENKSFTSSNVSSSLSNVSPILLQTVKVDVRGQNDSRPARVLFDTGAHCTYVNTKLARALNLEVIEEVKLRVTTFANPKPVERICNKVILHLINNKTGNGVFVVAYEIDDLCCRVQSRVSETLLKTLHSMRIDVGNSYSCNDTLSDVIDVVIGGDAY